MSLRVKEVSAIAIHIVMAITASFVFIDLFLFKVYASRRDRIGGLSEGEGWLREGDLRELFIERAHVAAAGSRPLRSSMCISLPGAG